MKKRFILFFIAIGLIMAFAPTTSMIDLRFIPVAPSINDSVWLLGHKKTTGVYTTYRFSMPQLASYLGAGTGLGNNFANDDLDLTDNRFHEFGKYGMVWDSVHYFNYVDSNGDTIIAINNSYTPNNCMFRVNSYVGNSTQIGIKGGATQLSLTVPSTNLHCKATAYIQTSTTGQASHKFFVNGVIPFTIDSIGSKVTIGVTPHIMTWDWATGDWAVNNAYRMARAGATDTTQVYNGGDGFAADSYWDYPRTQINHHVTDANYTIAHGNQTVFLPDITADRTLTFPTITFTNGYLLEIINQNGSGFNWNFAGAAVKDALGSTVTSMTVNAYQLRWDRTYWVIVSKY